MVRFRRQANTQYQPADDDVALAGAAAHGDRQAFARLYDRYVDRIYAYAVWRLANREAAEEATQQIFFRALRGIGTYRPEQSFVPWLFTIARNVVTDHLRTRRYHAVPLDIALDLADPGPSPAEHALQAAAREELIAARRTCLTASERELFDLVLAELSHHEIADLLGRQPGAIRTAHWRLLKSLRACLTGAHPTEEAADVTRA